MLPKSICQICLALIWLEGLLPKECSHPNEALSVAFNPLPGKEVTIKTVCIFLRSRKKKVITFWLWTIEDMNIVRLGGHHPLRLNISHGTSVNQSLTQFYLWPNVFVLTISTLVNLKAAMVIGKQERTRINQLIIWDCFANIFTMCVYVFDQSPWVLISPLWLTDHLRVNILDHRSKT